MKLEAVVKLKQNGKKNFKPVSIAIYGSAFFFRFSKKALDIFLTTSVNVCLCKAKTGIIHADYHYLSQPSF